MPTWRRRGSGWRSSSSVVSNSASVLSTRGTPAWRSSAWTPASSPSAPAVCDGASRAAAAVALDRQDRLRRETHREICEKRRGLLKDSTLSAMTAERGSSASTGEECVETSTRLRARRRRRSPSRRAAAWPSSAARARRIQRQGGRPPRVDLAEQRVRSPRRVGVDEADAVRPDEAHARARAPRAASSRSRPSGSRSPRSRSPRRARRGRPRGGLDDHVEYLAHRNRDGARARAGRRARPIDGTGGSGHEPAAATHHRRHAGEPAERPQQLPADAALPRRGTDDSDGRRRGAGRSDATAAAW